MRRAVKLAGILGALGCLFVAQSAQAQCVEAPVGTVSCTGADADGFAAAADNVDVTVDAGATVDGGATESILILDDSTVTNDGTINDLDGDPNAIDAGDNATITNQGVGEIHGGTGGVAVQFSGTDSDADNVLINSGSGVIDTLETIAVQGSVGNEAVTLQDTSTLTGDIDLGAGNDGITVSVDAMLNGSVDLGDGTNTFRISNNAEMTGTITGGSEGDTVDITGDSTVTGNVILGDGSNVFNITGTADLTGSITGGADDDTLRIEADTTVGGAIDLGDGANSLTIFSATSGNVNGNITGGADADTVTVEDSSFYGTDMSASMISLGAGDDSLTILNDATVYATVEMGGGSDTVAVRSPNVDGGNTLLSGSIDLGVADDVADDVNSVNIRSDVTFAGDISGGLGDDTVTASPDATLTGTINLGGGDNTVTVFQGAGVAVVTLGDGDDSVVVGASGTVSGAMTLGAGNDTVAIGVGAMTLDVTMGDGDDTFTFEGGGAVDGELDMGPGDDVVIYDFVDDPDDLDDFGVSGDIDFGTGSDTFALTPSSTLPPAADFNFDDAGDTLQLTSFPSVATAIVGSVNLSGATEFDRLVIGPDDQAAAFIWLVSTDAGDPAEFTDGITHQSGALFFDGTVELMGPFTQQREAEALATTQAPRMIFDLGLGADDDTNGQLVLDGVLTLEDRIELGDPMDETDDQEGASVDVTFTSRIVEDEYTLIVAEDGIVGEFDTETFPTSAVFSFETAIEDGDDLGDPNDQKFVLRVVRELFYDDLARSTSEARVGEYLEEGRQASGAGAFVDVVNALDGLNSRDLETALAQTTPEAYDAHTSSILSWGRMHQRVLQQRSMRCDRFTYTPRPEIVSDSPCGSKGIMPWAKVVGDMGDHKGDDLRGYETLGGGVLLGIDHRWNESLWWSADVGFGRVDIEHDNGTDAEFDTIDFGFAAGTEILGITTRGSFTYSHGFHETTRKIDFVNDRVTSKHDSDRVGIAAGAEYRVPLGPFVIEPNASVDYTHVKEESIEESGNDLVGLDVSSRKTDIVSVAGGVRLGTNLLKYRYAGDWLEWADGVWSPNVSVQWRQAFGDVDRDQKASMQGAPGGIGSFESAAKDSNGGVEVGGHLSFQPLNTASTVEVGYDGYFGDDVTNHSANVTVRIPF